MRTPVVIVTGQGGNHEVAGALLAGAGTRTTRTALVEHRFDGHVVHRITSTVQDGVTVSADSVLELTNCCVSCTVREDLLSHLRHLHRRPDVDRIAVRLDAWMEPEPVCFAVTHSPAARDVALSAVIATVDSADWLGQALGEDVLDDGRTVAQVVVAQVEFADVVVLTDARPDTLAVVRRLAPRARVTVGARHLATALTTLDADARRGRSDDLHGSLLAGQPELDPEGQVRLVEFQARRPFHPNRLHDAIDVLLEGVIRSRGRLWLASTPDRAMWLESAGAGLRISQAGKWLAAMGSRELAYVGPERRAMADLMWDHHYGDRHTSMTVLLCGADPAVVHQALQAALLTDAEMSRPQEWRHYDDPFGDWDAEEAQLA